MSKFGIFVFSLTAFAALIVVLLPDGAEASPSLEDSLNVAEALRYLEEMDKIYATISRPRFGRSIGSNRRGSGVNTLRLKKAFLENERR